jgi:AmmeMemoRadiSam system protein B
VLARRAGALYLHCPRHSTILFGDMGVTPLKASIRPPIVDGLFYPSKREALAALIDDLLSRSPVPRGSSMAVISPHAGYEYAGGVMAAAFSAIALRRVRTAVLIGPVHRDPELGIFLPESEMFSTPLGEISVDGDAAAALIAADPIFRRYDTPHLEEHCLEVQLPFLARIFPGAAIVPMLMGSTGMAAVAALVRSLQSVFAARAESTVFIVSANMASYMTGRDVEAENTAVEDLISRADWKGVMGASEKRRISTCGASVIAALISFVGDGCQARVLARSSSRGRDEDPTRIVHYAAVSLDKGARVEG